MNSMDSRTSWHWHQKVLCILPNRKKKKIKNKKKKKKADCKERRLSCHPIRAQWIFSDAYIYIPAAIFVSAVDALSPWRLLPFSLFLYIDINTYLYDIVYRLERWQWANNGCPPSGMHHPLFDTRVLQPVWQTTTWSCPFSLHQNVFLFSCFNLALPRHFIDDGLDIGIA